MHKPRIIFGCMIAVVALLLWALIKPGPDAHRSSATASPLVMLCAAGMSKPVAEIAAQYEAETGQPIQLDFAGSGTLYTKLKIANADIYLAADNSYAQKGQQEGLLAEALPVAPLTAGLAVAKGNPLEIHSLQDLLKDDLKIGIASPDAASVGKFTKKILTNAGLWDKIETRVFLTTPTVTELANAQKLGIIDVCIVWDATANQYPELDFVHVPEFDAKKKEVTVTVLSASSRATESLRFCRYLSARDKGLPIFKTHGFDIGEGDLWSTHPEVLLYSGAMLRPAIQETLKRFEAREGCRVTPVYNGCGVLVSQIRAGERPDAYFSCDQSFMDDVGELFMSPTQVSNNKIVILVSRGNPKGITSLADLAKGDVRLGFAHPEKSALGALTKRMLIKQGLYQKILDSGNLTGDSATGDFLVNQLRANALDAGIVYRSNAESAPGTMEHCAIIPISIPEAQAFQPYAVGKNSDHKQLLNRLLQAIISAEGKKQFDRFGFGWQIQTPGA
jgi:molybdate transport system substrate-binding protein